MSVIKRIYLKFKSIFFYREVYCVPTYVELIGVSGVGKSTLYEKLKIRNREWITLNEFKAKLSKSHHQLRSELDKEDIYQILSDYKFKSIEKSKILATDRFRVAYWNYLNLLDDLLIKNYNVNDIILSDEGLLHNFSKEYLVAFNSKMSNNINDFLKNRAIIYCYTDVNLIVNQIKKREEELGHIISYHKNLSLNELKDYVSSDLLEKEKFISSLETNGVPVLRICTNQNFEDINYKIKHFIKKINSPSL